MNKEELLALGLTEDIADKVLEKYGKFVPYDRFKEAIDEKNEIKNQLSQRDEQLEELKKLSENSEDLNTKIAELQKLNENTTKEYETQIAQIKLDNAIDVELSSVGALNKKAVRALLDNGKIKLENDTLQGLSEQLAELKKSDGYLFKSDDEDIKPIGINPATSNANTQQTNITLASALSSIYNK